MKVIWQMGKRAEIDKTRHESDGRAWLQSQLHHLRTTIYNYEIPLVLAVPRTNVTKFQACNKSRYSSAVNCGAHFDNEAIDFRLPAPTLQFEHPLTLPSMLPSIGLTMADFEMVFGEDS